MNTDRFIHKRAYTDAEYHEDAEQDLVKSRRFRVMLLRQNSLYKAGFRREKELGHGASDEQNTEHERDAPGV